MYKDHQPKIARFARANADNLFEVLAFAVVTARQPLRDAVDDMREVRRRREKATCLFGWKSRAVAELWRDRAEIWEDCARIAADHVDDAAADLLVMRLTRCHGLGFAKAGFAVQMAYGLSGCLDTHNLDRYEIPRNMVKSEKAKNGRRAHHIAAYNVLCRRLGGTAALWDTWCEYVAAISPLEYGSAERVSALHVKAFETKERKLK